MLRSKVKFVLVLILIMFAQLNSAQEYQVKYPTNNDNIMTILDLDTGERWVQKPGEEKLLELTSKHKVWFSMFGTYFCVMHPWDGGSISYSVYDSSGTLVKSISTGDTQDLHVTKVLLSENAGQLVLFDNEKGKFKIFYTNSSSFHEIDLIPLHTESQYNPDFITANFTESGNMVVVNVGALLNVESSPTGALTKAYDIETGDLVWEQSFDKFMQLGEKFIYFLDSRSSKNGMYTLARAEWEYGKPRKDRFDGVRTYLIDNAGIIKAEYTGMFPDLDDVSFNEDLNYISVYCQMGFYVGKSLINGSTGQVESTKEYYGAGEY